MGPAFSCIFQHYSTFAPPKLTKMVQITSFTVASPGPNSLFMVHDFQDFFLSMSHSQVDSAPNRAPNSEVPVTPYTPNGLVHGIIDIVFQNRQHLELLHDGRLERSQDLLEVVLGVGADVLPDFSDPKQVTCRSSA